MTDKLTKNSESAKALAQRIKGFTSGLPGAQEKLGIKREISSSQPLLDVVFLFDTTGSMYPFFEHAKNSISIIIEEIGKRIKKVKFGWVAYKNHGDEGYFKNCKAYVATNLTENVTLIKEAMEEVKKGGGGNDALTCIEDAFHHLNFSLAWDNTAAKVAVLIGDMPPHGILDSIAKCPFEYNWRQELEELKHKGIKVYSVFCCEEKNLSTRLEKVRDFFKETAEISGGKFLEFVDIGDLVDLLVGICLKETKGLDDFIADLKNRNLLTPKKKEMLLQLKEGGKNG